MNTEPVKKTKLCETFKSTDTYSFCKSPLHWSLKIISLIFWNEFKVFFILNLDKLGHLSNANEKESVKAHFAIPVSFSGSTKELHKIIWIVRSFWLVYKFVFIGPWSSKRMSAVQLAVSKLWEFPFFERYKTIPRQSLWKLSSRSKLEMQSRVFSNSPKRLPFFPGYEVTENIFYFLNLVFVNRDYNSQ